MEEAVREAQPIDMNLEDRLDPMGEHHELLRAHFDLIQDASELLLLFMLWDWWYNTKKNNFLSGNYCNFLILKPKTHETYICASFSCIYITS